MSPSGRHTSYFPLPYAWCTISNVLYHTLVVIRDCSLTTGQGKMYCSLSYAGHKGRRVFFAGKCLAQFRNFKDCLKHLIFYKYQMYVQVKTIPASFITWGLQFFCIHIRYNILAPKHLGT